VTSCAVIRKLEPPAASPEGAQSPAASTSAKGSPYTTSSGRPLAMPLSPELRLGPLFLSDLKFTAGDHPSVRSPVFPFHLSSLPSTTLSGEFLAVKLLQIESPWHWQGRLPDPHRQAGFGRSSASNAMGARSLYFGCGPKCHEGWAWLSCRTRNQGGLGPVA
jgi:hypothetical protein